MKNGREEKALHICNRTGNVVAANYTAMKTYFTLLSFLLCFTASAQSIDDIAGNWQLAIIESDKVIIDVSNDTIIIKTVGDTAEVKDLYNKRENIMSFFKKAKLIFKRDMTYVFDFLGEESGTFVIDQTRSSILVTNSDGTEDIYRFSNNKLYLVENDKDDSKQIAFIKQN